MVIRGNLWELMSDDAVERIGAAATRLLTEHGARVEHEGVLERLGALGCTVDPASRRCRFTRALIDRVTRAAADNDEPPAFHGPRGWHPASARLTSLGGSFPHFLDWPGGERRLATADDVIAMAKMGQMLDEIHVVGQSLTASDVDPRIEPIWNVVTNMAHTTKAVGPGEVLYPQNIKHLARLSELASGRAGANHLIADCNFIISPLIFNRRAIECMIEKARFGIRCVIGSMPVAGMSSPVTVAGTAAVGLAELLGGWCIAHAIGPDIRVGGVMSSGALDMKTTIACFGSPEAMLQDIAVIQCCRRLYGVSSVGAAFVYVDATTPGIRAALEKFATLASLPLTGQDPFFALGLLSAGQDYSPVQHMLECDMQAMYRRFMAGVEVSDETLAVETITDVMDRPGATFLDTDHTLEHYAAELWMPRWLERTPWRGTEIETKTEHDMLERIDRYWKDAVAAYERPNIDESKLAAAEEILAAARQEMEHVAFAV